jgi:2-polyprenyl-3-methyl-5-hydroxy-6-metoxy-1,4-benzoquinol methylase
LGFQFEHVLCNVCGVDDCHPVAVGEDFEYGTSDQEFMAVQCRRCDTVYLNPRPDSDGIRLAYPENYHAFQFDESEFGLVYRVRQRLEARRLLRWCRGLPDGAAILDIGCGDGFHVELLRKFGKPTWEVDGVDSDSRAVSGARKRGIDIHQGSIEELNLKQESYDLILMIMTIEHVCDPLAMLKVVSGLLKPGGRLVIVTDNTGSPDFRIFGNRHWGGYHFPRHLYLFNRRNLSQLCDRAGLKTVSVKSALSPVNWTYSFRNWIQDWKGPSWLKNRLSLSSPLSLAIFTAIDLPLSMVGIGAILHGVFVKEKSK